MDHMVFAAPPGMEIQLKKGGAWLPVTEIDCCAVVTGTGKDRVRHLGGYELRTTHDEEYYRQWNEDRKASAAGGKKWAILTYAPAVRPWAGTLYSSQNVVLYGIYTVEYCSHFTSQVPRNNRFVDPWGSGLVQWRSVYIPTRKNARSKSCTVESSCPVAHKNPHLRACREIMSYDDIAEYKVRVQSRRTAKAKSWHKKSVGRRARRRLNHLTQSLLVTPPHTHT